MAVIAGELELKVPDGEMSTFTYRPEGEGPFPAIIVCQAALGVNDEIKGDARAFAEQGYFAVAPNFYHRAGNKPAANMEEAVPLRVGMTDDGIVDDLKALMVHLQSIPDVVQADQIGVMGCCQGGRTSFIAATRVPGIACGVIYYGGGIVPRADAPLNELLQANNPIDYADGLSCPVIGFFGDNDARIPMADYYKVEDTLKELKKDFEFHVYEGAGHGFLHPQGPNYHPEASKDSWARTLAFLEKRLKGARSSEPAGSRP